MAMTSAISPATNSRDKTVRFADRLASLRRARGISQSQLASAAGITKRMVVAYEAEDATPPAPVLPRLAKALGVTVDELLAGSIIGRKKVQPRRVPARRLKKTVGKHPPNVLGFGVRLAELRRSRALTQPELAAAVGISQRMVAYYEAQEQAPAILLASFADALGVTIDELFGRTTLAATVSPTNLRIWRNFRGLEKLSPRDRQAIRRQIDALLLRSQREDREG